MNNCSKISLFVRITRAYSLPMSFMAWLVPFVFALTNGGSIFKGVLALLGIISVHLGANMFDDFIDYRRYLKEKNPLQKGKCSFFIENEISMKNFILIFCAFFAAALLIGSYFIFLYKLPIIILIAITGILCLLYPRSSYFGFGEAIIALIFSPLALTGVYYVMTQSFSKPLIWLSVPFGIMVVALLYTHSFLDFNYDFQDGKKTLCTLCKGKKHAHRLFGAILVLAYFFLGTGIFLKVLPPVFAVTFFSIFAAVSLLKTLKNYIEKAPADEKEFLAVFNEAQKLTVIFTILSVAAIVFS